MWAIIHMECERNEVAGMRPIRVYVDTSVFGGTQDKEFAQASNRFFDFVRAGKYRVLISPGTLAELRGAPETVRESLADLPKGSVEEVPAESDINELTQAYIDAGAATDTRRTDATHVAAATVARADLLLSWNFKHIVNYHRIQVFNGVNVMKGYPQIEIRSPLELANGDEDENV